MPSTGLPQEVIDHTYQHPHRFNELATKSGMGSSGWNVPMADTHLWKYLWVYCPGHAGVMGNNQADRLTGRQNNPHKWLASQKIWSVEKFQTLPVGTNWQSQGHHITDRLEERGLERGSARWSSLEGRERAIINQTLEPFQRQRENF